MKIIQVHDETHKMIKEQAERRGMTMKGYLKILVSDDIAKMKGEKNGN